MWLAGQRPLEYPGPSPGMAQASIQNDEIILGNDAIACKWSVRGWTPQAPIPHRQALRRHAVAAGQRVFSIAPDRRPNAEGSDLKFAAGGREVDTWDPALAEITPRADWFALISKHLTAALR